MERLGILDIRNVPIQVLDDLRVAMWELFTESRHGFSNFYVEKTDPRAIHWLSPVAEKTKSVAPNDAFIGITVPGHVGHMIHLPAYDIANKGGQASPIFQKLTYYLQNVDLSLCVPKSWK